MSIQTQLQADLKTAMRAGEKERVGVIRMALAALQSARLAQQKEAFDAATQRGEEEITLDRSSEMSDAVVQDVLKKEVRRRYEAAEIYRKAGRLETAAQEEAEAAILEGYLPRLLSADELRPLIAEAIAAIGPVGMSEMGKVMPVLMRQFKDRADGRVINQVAREILQSKQA